MKWHWVEKKSYMLFMDANQKFLYVGDWNEQSKSREGETFFTRKSPTCNIQIEIIRKLCIYLNKNLNFCQGSLKWITTMSRTHSTSYYLTIKNSKIICPKCINMVCQICTYQPTNQIATSYQKMNYLIQNFCKKLSIKKTNNGFFQLQ